MLLPANLTAHGFLSDPKRSFYIYQNMIVYLLHMLIAIYLIIYFMFVFDVHRTPDTVSGVPSSPKWRAPWWGLVRTLLIPFSSLLAATILYKVIRTVF